MKKGICIFLLCLLLALCSSAFGEGLEPLPMDSTAIAPPPRDECYLDDWTYEDESITVRIFQGEKKIESKVYRQAIPYTCAYIKITHPSQLRAVPAAQVDDPRAVFNARSTRGARCTQIAKVANAVIAINGDYCANADKCHVVLRQGQQVRNKAEGMFDVLIIDKNGDFDAIPNCTKDDYIAYYTAHEGELYQAFCFGPVLVRDGECALTEDYGNGYMISDTMTQRVALCQIGELEYMIITCDGDAQWYTFGMTVLEFAQFVAEIGREYSPEGFKLAYNLDGGNSASLVFKQRDAGGSLKYVKLNMPERDRDLSDMVCFVTLVK